MCGCSSPKCSRPSASRPKPTRLSSGREAAGDGYGAHESGKRLLRLHAAEIVEHIERKAGDDVLKQMELGKAVHERLSTQASKEEKEEQAINAFIVDSVREWCAVLRTVYNGRFPNDSDVRVDYLFAVLSCQRFTE